MKFVSAAGIRDGEGEAIRRNPALDRAMMDAAGMGLAHAIRSIARHLDPPDPGVRLLAGPGNNGGDVFAAAVYLAEMGMNPEVWLASSVPQLKGAARHFYQAMAAARIPFQERTAEEDWASTLSEVRPPSLLVDGLLGTGSKGAPRGIIACAAAYLRRRRNESLILSVDIPTGMDADTGTVADGAVQADFTVTMEHPKAGMAASPARECLGSLWRVPVGLPAKFAQAIPDALPGLQWISEQDVRNVLPPRPRESHKGHYGTAMLLGGMPPYPGAIVLAAEGAVRSGAGLVRVAASEAAVSAIAARIPAAIAGADLSADLPLEGISAILAGPGLGRDPEARRLVARLLHEAACPLVLDADALAILEGRSDAIRQCPAPVVLTPHPGELARLLGTSAAAIQQDRLAAVREAADRTGATVILKGSGTLVAKEGESVWINLNGNPGMACGGSGDVLAGLLAGLLAQRMDPFQAACAAAWLHGAAGDVAALRKTRTAMNAADISRALPDAFRQVGVR
ncbi:MAG: NAD(P)H-hydrate dehydratase [Lentisphaerae bacterium]|nr:NAD(P)H-hydrate dehydratase [Lentisphaerota bacterium]